jgi:hypothetical protein
MLGYAAPVERRVPLRPCAAPPRENAPAATSGRGKRGVIEAGIGAARSLARSTKPGAK